MKDDQYPVDVTLHYVAYPKQNVIKTWSEIKHQQKKPIVLWRYASTMLYFSNQKYYLTEFSSDWAKEVQMSTQQLQPGKRFSIRSWVAVLPCTCNLFLNSDWNSPLRSIRDK